METKKKQLIVLFFFKSNIHFAKPPSIERSVGLLHEAVVVNDDTGFLGG